LQIKTTKKDYLWSYIGYFLNLSVNVILLPVILHFLSQEEMGIWYTFVSIYTVIILIDFGFTPTLVRSLTYAWSGAKEIKPEGVSYIKNIGDPNRHLFATIFLATKRLCFILALAVLLLMTTCGTIYIHYISKGLVNKSIVIAWILYSIGGWANIYFNYLVLGLKSTGAIADSQQAVVISKIVQLIVSSFGVINGGGLIALSVSYIISGFAMRIVARIKFYTHGNIGEWLHEETVNITGDEIIKTFRILWFNAKRAGSVVIASTIMMQSGVLFCSAFIGINATAVYGLCIQLNTVLFGVGQIFYQTNIAALTNAKINGDKRKQQRIFSTAVVVLWCIAIPGIIVLAFCGNFLINLLGSNTPIQISVLLLVCLYMLLEQNYSLSTNYISLSNTYPFMKSFVISAILQVSAFFGLIIFAELHIWHILLINTASRLFYISWKWPLECLKELGMTASQLMRLGFSNIFEMLRLLIFGGKDNECSSL
jgi:O-antigen/teichoic acid export membrane protein